LITDIDVTKLRGIAGSAKMRAMQPRRFPPSRPRSLTRHRSCGWRRRSPCLAAAAA